MADVTPSGFQPFAQTAAGTVGALSITVGTTTNKGRLIYLTGISYQSTGATTATNVTITVQYTPVFVSPGPTPAVTIGTWSYTTGGTATTANSPLVINLPPAPSYSYTAIDGTTNSTTTTPTGSLIISATAAGAGATGACLNVWGYLQ